MGNTKEDIDAIETAQRKDKIGVLFVCLGNICRSPAAHAIFEDIVAKRNCADRFMVDSAGLYEGHAGDLPDKRMRTHASRRGYSLTHRSRPVRESDFEDFDVIVAMDNSNYDNLKRMAPTVEDEKKVVRMIDFCEHYPEYHSVPDPYYEGAEGFEIVLNLLEDGCEILADRLLGPIILTDNPIRL